MPNPPTPRMGSVAEPSASADSGGSMERPGTARSQKVFKAYPEEVFFRDIEQNKSYVAWVTVRNDSVKRRKIRVQKPNTSQFTIEVHNQDQNGFLSPGLSLKIKVTFMTHYADMSLHDTLVLRGDADDSNFTQFMIPLHALAFAANIQFDKFVNLGTVVTGSSIVQYITFRNNGKKRGAFKMTFKEDCPLRITPTEGVLTPAGEAGSSLDVKLEYAPTELGIINFQGQVAFPGSETEDVPQLLDIKGNVVDQSLQLVMPGQAAGPVNEIAFGSVYFGQTRIAKGFLVNNSPFPSNFTIVIAEGKRDKNNMTEDSDIGGDSVPNSIIIIPSEGRLQPYSKMELQFVFQPAAENRSKGWGHQYVEETEKTEPQAFVVTAMVESQESKQRLIVALNGKAVAPNLQVSEKELDFGNCPVHERRDISVTLSNKSALLPVSYAFNKIAHFSCAPVRGKLLPLQSRNVLVTYIPRNMGKQASTITLEIEKGLQEFLLSVKGVSQTTGKSAQKLDDGTKLPVDFKPHITFVDPDNLGYVTKSKMAPHVFDRFGKTDLQGLNDTQFESRYTYPIEQYQETMGNKAMATNFVRESYQSRVKAGKDKTRLDPTDPISMGLDFAEGLDEPKIDLPEPEGKLWLQYNMGSYEGQSKHKVAQNTDSTRGSGPKKFKAQPTTQAERRDCETTLSHQDLQNVVRKQKVVDFGRLFLQATSTKQFSVTNQLEQHILVQLSLDSIPELCKSKGLSQMIPPGRTADFDLFFQSDRVQEFKTAVQYTINNIHNYTFMAQCEVVPVSLQSDKKTMFFQFAGDNNSFSCTDTVLLTNPSNVLVDYWFTSESDGFTINPQKGSLGHFAKQTITVTYGPKFAQKRFTGELELHVKNGPVKSIQCQAVLPEASCVLKQSELDLGLVCVGQRRIESVIIKNNGKVKTVFSVEATPPGVQVTPLTAALNPGQSMPLNVYILAKNATVWDHSVNIDVRGKTPKSKPVKFQIKGQGVIPDVEIMEDQFDFGGVTMGVPSSLPITFTNRGAVTVSLYLDLTDHPDFSIQFPQEWLKLEHCPIRRISSVEATGVAEGREAVQTEPKGGVILEDGFDEDEKDAYKILVGANTEVGIELVFTPQQVCTHSFLLPIFLGGLPNYANIKRVVVGEGLKPRVLLTRHAVDFGNRVTLKQDRALKIPYMERLEMRNEDLCDLEWCLRLPDVIEGQPITDRQNVEDAPEAAQGKNMTWRVEPSSGTMLPGQSTVVSIYFAPTRHMQFEFSLGLFLGEQSEAEVAYYKIPVSGRGTFPMLSFDREEVNLPPVPLGFISKDTFKILNHGYENLELRYHLPQDSSRVPLTVSFPNGSTLGIGREQITVEVSFMSKKPMGFNANLDFLDTDGNKFTVCVSGITDNSLLSVQEYVDTNRAACELSAKENTGVTLTMKSSKMLSLHLQFDQTGTMDVDAKGVPPRVPDLTNTSAETLFDGTLRSVMSYLFGASLLPSNLDFEAAVRSFPSDFVADDGRLFMFLVKQLSGKNPGGAAAKKDKGEKIGDTIADTLAMFNRVLTFLKSNGALVNGVRACYLLSGAAYQRYTSLKEGAAPSAGQKAVGGFGKTAKLSAATKMLPQKSRHVWLVMLVQTIRVFVLSRVTPKQYKVKSGLPADKSNVEPNTLNSNIYSPSEALLLHWLGYHFAAMNQHAARRILNFDTDLADGLALAAALKAHAPNLKSLETLNFEPETEAQRLSNCSKVPLAIKEMGLTYPLTADEIVRPCARNMLLFVLFLYQKLPSFIPKTIIEFTGALDMEMVKHIELKNPSKLPVVYSVSLEGSGDFHIDEDTVNLDAKGKEGDMVKFAVRLKARFSKSVEGRIVFTSARDGGAVASTLVFLLKSNITARTAREKVVEETTCYQAKELKIHVTNPFADDCTFKIMVLPMDEPLVMKSKPPAPSKKGKKAFQATAGFQKEEKALPSAFFCKLTKIKIKAHESATLPVQFLPLRVGRYVAQLVLLDDNIGELMYEMDGTSHSPVPLETVKWSMTGKQSMTKEMSIEFKNPHLEQARAAFNERMNGLSRKQKEALKELDPPNKPRMLILPTEVLPENTIYTVTSSSPFFIVPPSISLALTDGGGPSDKPNRKAAAASQAVMLPLTFNPKQAGIYKAEICLQSAADTRVYFLDATVKEETETPTLEFKIPAGESITQEIPVINNTTESWQIKMSTLNGAGFSGPPDMTVPAKSTEMYMLSFKPTWVCDVTGRLELVNLKTTDQYSYDLKGIGQEPLAVDHIRIECQARQKVSQVLKVVNTTAADVTYVVESDLPNISGDSMITVSARHTGEYTLTICPQLGGIYRGSISFVAPGGRFCWYAVELEADSPTPEQTLEVKAFARKAAAVQISMTNPLDEVLEFDVRINAEGVFGEPIMTLGPRELGTYEFVFSPLLAGTSKGSVSFVNEKAGEFWYDLVLTGENPPPTQLQDMKCSVGNKTTQTVVLDNPMPNDIIVKGNTSNKKNFSFSPNVLIIPAYDSLEITITYTPSSMGEWQTSDISFQHPSVGAWMFTLRGEGTRPKKMPLLTVSAGIGSRLSHSMAFTNPFASPIKVDVTLAEENTHAFELYLKRTSQTLAPQGTMQIPFVFQPQVIQTHAATITVKTPDIEQGIEWTYPIKGVGEGPIADSIIEISCQARSKFKKSYNLNLTGVLPGRLEHYTCQVELPSDDLNFLKRVLTVQLQDTQMKAVTTSQDMLVHLNFEPLRPIKTPVELVVYKRSGGRWRFPMAVHVAEPEIDDEIKIESMIHTTSSVSFTLTNQFEIFSDFSAFLSPDSAPEFKVYPTSGILEPMSNPEGTKFIVSFSPLEYGKQHSGTLVILTDDMQWTYQLTGTHPRYVVPQPKAYVDTRMSMEVMKQTQGSKKNFFRENFAALKTEPGATNKVRQRVASRKSRGKQIDTADRATLQGAIGGKITMMKSLSDFS